MKTDIEAFGDAAVDEVVCTRHTEWSGGAEAVVGEIEEGLDVVQACPVRVARSESANVEIEFKEAKVTAPLSSVTTF